MNQKTASNPGASTLRARKDSGADISDWRPEDETFWENTGKRIAYRNLWISVPSLLCGFAVWGMWGIITVQMMNLGSPFSPAELFTLTAIAGRAGATMRLPWSTLIRPAGRRDHTSRRGGKGNRRSNTVYWACGKGHHLNHPDRL